MQLYKRVINDRWVLVNSKGEPVDETGAPYYHPVSAMHIIFEKDKNKYPTYEEKEDVA